jgi:hypothetical protein
VMFDGARHEANDTGLAFILGVTNSYNVTCTDWINLYFGECVYSAVGYWGFGIGLTSVVFFFLALLP